MLASFIHAAPVGPGCTTIANLASAFILHGLVLGSKCDEIGPGSGQLTITECSELAHASPHLWGPWIPTFPFSHSVSEVQCGHDCECSLSTLNFIKIYCSTKRLASKRQNVKTVFLTVVTACPFSSSPLHKGYAGGISVLFEISVHILEYSSELKICLKQSECWKILETRVNLVIASFQGP